MKRRLLCTDLDRTLIPNGQQVESPAAAGTFQRLVERPEVSLAYVTGRHLELVHEAIGQYALPQPDYVLGDVGASIYCRKGEAFQRDAKWDQRLAYEWPSSKVARLQSQLAGFPELQLQDADKQARFKLSYYLPPDADHSALEVRILHQLAEFAACVNLVFSFDSQADVGLLDVLPPSASKLRAIQYLISEQSIALDDVVFAGDSGNDKDVFDSEIQSVMVANAAPDLKAWAEQNRLPAIYIARGIELKRRLVNAGSPVMRSEALSELQTPVPAGESVTFNGNYRGGIIEGMLHYWPEVAEWLVGQESCGAT